MNSDDFKTLQFEYLDGQVLKIAIDHPDSAMNAVDDTLHSEFTRLFRELKQEDDLTIVIVKLQAE